MHGGNIPERAEAKARRARGVLVRDVPVRIFHWSLVAAVTALAVSGFLGPENWLPLHAAAGYALVILVLFRLLWWGLGGRYSRLSAYPLSPSAARAHLRGLFAGRNPLRAGHNPLGAANIVIMISLLSLLAVTGLIALGGQELRGPLRAFVSYATGERALVFHKILAWGLLAAIGGHLAGVALETRVFGHPLLAAMTVGRMPVEAREAERGSQARRGLVVFLLVIIATSASAAWLSRISPARRWHAVTFPAVYADNCGDCHVAHHPSLRGADMWQRIVSTLQDHYGEDASVDAADARAILRFLRANDANHFDTEAAVRMGRVATSDLRITSTPRWKRRHAAIPRRVFKSAAVGSRANCNACHADAASGLFDGGAIRIPPKALKPSAPPSHPSAQQKGDPRS